MALDADFVDDHIARWQGNLTSNFYLHRRHWPAHLFHHAPLENALLILRDGHIRSRNDPANGRVRDVAAPGVIDARSHAHNFTRLYFRPKTPTQWHIEGIRKAGECNYGDDTHAPVLIMFILDAKSVLTTPGVQFSDKNMQLQDASWGQDAEFFKQIPFAKVFSEGSTGGDRSFTDARCAEVLAQSPLDLRQCLRSICFRSEPERETFLYMLGDARHLWETYCHVSDALKVFEKQYAFLQDLRLTRDGVVFRINPRKDSSKVEITINISDLTGRPVADFRHGAHEASPPRPNVNWIWRVNLADGIYKVEVHLEKHLAYRNSIVLGDTLF